MEAEWHRRRRQFTVSGQVLSARMTNDLTRYVEATLLKWPEKPVFGFDTTGSTYGAVFKAQWLMSQYIIVKETREFSFNINHALLHEIEMSDTFQEISPRCLGLQPFEQHLRVAYDYLPADLVSLMEEGLSVNYNIPYELARIMAEISEKSYMLREFRLEKFLGRLSE